MKYDIDIHMDDGIRLYDHVDNRYYNVVLPVAVCGMKSKYRDTYLMVF